ncbi:TPA: 50S ribosomal protein L2 [Candidatus Bathyarchaeota archaeon]|nr:50S ribosomal protein L2 [Candidatus Bathyarchaeota archaeon]HIJ08518.1 50S ribosomal protein L2 [Candidatus Bathyarchaeota archaeon]
MGKRIRVQRRGRGGSTYRASTHKRVAPAKYPMEIAVKQIYDASVRGVIEEFLHDPGRGAPLSFVRFDNGVTCYTLAPEGVFLGQQIGFGGRASVDVGNVIPLGRIPEGTMICNLELKPGDGGKLARSSGAYTTVVGHTPQGTMIRLPSGRTRYVNDNCLATVGVISAGGRTEKPYLKAGEAFHMMRAKGHKYPRTRGRAMVAAVHPFGSSKRSARKGTTTSHGAPPGQKVGLISARGTGRRQKKRRSG